jgi:hypothetical protein
MQRLPVKYGAHKRTERVRVDTRHIQIPRSISMFRTRYTSCNAVQRVPATAVVPNILSQHTHQDALDAYVEKLLLLLLLVHMLC